MPHSFSAIEIILIHHPQLWMALRDGNSSYDGVQAIVAGEIRNTGAIELGSQHAQAGDVTHVERMQSLHTLLDTES